LKLGASLAQVTGNRLLRYFIQNASRFSLVFWRFNVPAAPFACFQGLRIILRQLKFLRFLLALDFIVLERQSLESEFRRKAFVSLVPIWDRHVHQHVAEMGMIPN
jgi:hypothetical protein